MLRVEMVVGVGRVGSTVLANNPTSFRLCMKKTFIRSPLDAQVNNVLDRRNIAAKSEQNLVAGRKVEVHVVTRSGCLV